MPLECSRMSRSDTTMSTSELNRIDSSRSDEKVLADKGATASVGTLPDIAMLTQMANEFFHAPAQTAIPVVAQPSLNTSQAVPNFETRLPQFGTPAPPIP